MFECFIQPRPPIRFYPGFVSVTRVIIISPKPLFGVHGTYRFHKYLIGWVFRSLSVNTENSESDLHVSSAVTSFLLFINVRGHLDR